MLKTDDLSIEELHETCKKATATANAAEERIRAWNILNKGVNALIEAYVDDKSIPVWLDKMVKYLNHLRADRVENLDAIAKNARADAKRCLEVHQMRMDI